MNVMKVVSIALMALLSVMIVEAAAQTPVVNDDFIIVLDQSGSMREITPGAPGKYEKDPRNAYKSKGAMDALDIIVNTMLVNGDYFSLITFGNNAEVEFSQEIGFDHERDLFSRKIEQMDFGDQKTDILAGIKTATDLMVSMHTPERRKVFIMVTDGVNEPPEDSPYFAPEAQEHVYAELRDTIQDNKWNMTLVGVGQYTEENIRDIAQKLGLTPEQVVVIENPQSSEEMQSKITRIFEETREKQVKLEVKEIKLKLKPKLFGGYETGQDSLLLTAHNFKDPVQIELDPQMPLQVQGGEGLRIQVSPLSLSLPPQQPLPLTLDFALTGQRPQDGRLSGTFTFQITGSTAFNPKTGSFEVLLPSWWEVYGLWAAIAIAAAAIGLILLLWLLRKAQVPEIRIVAAANGQPLGPPVTLRKKQSFTFAKGDDMSGRTFAIKGLACQTAATAKYLGRRKFELKAMEAQIVYDGKEITKLVIGLDKDFALKDSSGKVLRGLTISASGKGGGDAFGGGGHGSQPF